MAALASLMFKSRAGLLLPCQSSLADWVRFASKKAGGSSKNLGGKSPGRRYGFKKTDGKSRYQYRDTRERYRGKETKHESDYIS